MTCHDVQSHLRSHAAGLTPAALRAQLDDHVRQCPACAEQLADLQAVAPFYRFTEVPTRSREFWARFVADVQTGAEALDQHRTAPAYRVRRWVLRHAWATTGVAVTAAVLAVWQFHGVVGNQPLPEREFAGAIEFYLDQHDSAVEGKALAETFTVHDKTDALQLVHQYGTPQ